ncbi:GNAT family N-acetyltransferase [Variovorax sp. J2P1-59]|uniref:GNAT family N-acetyltransferase n=1 Tax=Variovorax flavidus TaxID=3053501 RepID=UPI002576E191|nr:GNAT family N-acetyltransferase [Variovorax sp. J2P1-59]MDM0075806.1 GNAT family N-acetyltransferase [Variovorax sp. J2P1-59]
MVIRDATPADFPRILELNEAWVHFLAPLTRDRLEHLHAEAAYHRVVECDGAVAAFLLAFAEGAAYDSPNYRWFAANCERFVYIDRVVVSAECRNRGIGELLYQDLFAFAARNGAVQVTCEFDVDPPNEASRRFHERFGFREIGAQRVGASEKLVSLQAVALPG